MRILAIESSAVTASVAILTDDTLTAEYTINYKKTHSQTLLPMIDEICDMTDVKPDEFDVVAVSTGPGSFTGLRIGVATGKGIALATGIKMAAVPTLDAMAMNKKERAKQIRKSLLLRQLYMTKMSIFIRAVCLKRGTLL